MLLREDTLIGYDFAVSLAADPRVNNGEPVTMVHFACPVTGHVVRIPLSDDGRRQLVTALSSGIVLPEGVTV